MGVCCSENVQVTIAPTPVPITTTQASVTTTRIPVTATWAPITTTVSTTTTVAPITSTAAPVTTTRIPITVLPTTTFAPTPSSLATTQPTVKKGMLYTYKIFFYEQRLHLGCGELTIQTMRIVGGQPADKGKWPWMAALLRNKTDQVKFIAKCICSYISPVV